MNLKIKFLYLIFATLTLSSCLKDNVASEEQTKQVENLKQISDLNNAQNLGLKLGASGDYYYKKTTTNDSGHVFGIAYQAYIAYTISTINGQVKETVLPADSVYFGYYALNSTLPANLFSGFAYPVFVDLKTGESADYYFPSTLAYGDKPKLGFAAWDPVKLSIKIISHLDENQQINWYMKKNKITATSLSSNGLRYILTGPNKAGDSLVTGNKVTVKYNGKFLNGASFGSGTFDTEIGAATTVVGFREGIAKMRVGEKATLIFPSAIGYGSAGYDPNQNGNYSIPPYSPLLFEVQIVSKN